MEVFSDVVRFLGRFHPLVVHLPIGIITLGVVLQVISSRAKFEKIKPALPIIWLLAFLSASISVVLGIMHASGEDFEENALSFHTWSGILLTFITLIYYVSAHTNIRSGKPSFRPLHSILLILMSTLLLVTGHLGSSLTHGPTYLVEFAPSPIQKLFGLSTEQNTYRKQVGSLDSADVFDDGVSPILHAKCTSCHNKNKSKGKLILTAYDDLMNGGENGTVLTPGSSTSSELYRRITLPGDHKEFMPKEGKKPLTEDQVAIIEWWIEKGSLRHAVISSLLPDENMIKIFDRFYGLNKGLEEQLMAPPPDPVKIQNLLSEGFNLRLLATGSNLLSVSRAANVPVLLNLNSLSGIADQLVWLQLSNSGLQDTVLEILGELPNLRKLNLSKNNISDIGVNYLTGLAHLEYLNLYETKVSDSGAAMLATLPHLKELYLWQTNVSDSMMHLLKTQRPELKIIYQFDQMSETIN